MHQGQCCISRVLTARHHTENLLYPSFFVIVFHNDNPASQGGGLINVAKQRMGPKGKYSSPETALHLDGGMFQ